VSDFDAACAELVAAQEAGVFSAAALGTVGLDGERRSSHIGHAQRFVRGVDGALVEQLGERIGPDALFDLASLTKPIVTTTLIAKRLQAGVWDLGQSLRAVLPRIAGTPTPDVSLGALLCHSSGLPAWQDFYGATVGTAGAARTAAIQRLVAATDRPSQAGQRAVYSDLGFMMLGWALERAGDAPLDVLFEREVAALLQLEHLRFRRISALDGGSVDGRDDADRDGRPAICATEIWRRRCLDGRPLTGVVHDDNCAALDGVAGHAGLFGNLDDVLSWASLWLAAARGVPGFVPPFVMTDLLACRASSSTTWRGGFDTPSRGGSSAGSTPPSDAFGHLGFTGTSVWLSPTYGAIVLLTNRVHPSRDEQQRIKTLRPLVHDHCWRSLRRD
jgi:serine-type D-Ala-D-Ala carboxypeptidase